MAGIDPFQHREEGRKAQMVSRKNLIGPDSVARSSDQDLGRISYSCGKEMHKLHTLDLKTLKQRSDIIRTSFTADSRTIEQSFSPQLRTLVVKIVRVPEFTDTTNLLISTLIYLFRGARISPFLHFVRDRTNYVLLLAPDPPTPVIIRYRGWPRPLPVLTT